MTADSGGARDVPITQRGCSDRALERVVLSPFGANPAGSAPPPRRAMRRILTVS